MFINSRPSGADTQQSVNQTCIKLQGSEPAPDPVFWRVNNQGEKRGSTLFFLRFKNQLRLAEYQSHIASSSLPILDAFWGVGVLPQLKSLWSPPPFAWVEESRSVSLPPSTVGQSQGLRMRTLPLARRQSMRKNSSTQGGLQIAPSWRREPVLLAPLRIAFCLGVLTKISIKEINRFADMCSPS